MTKLSCVITAKDKDDPKLKDLLYSIDLQSFKDYEVLVITEGTSETAKAIGIKRAKGEIVCILASDNYLNDTDFFKKCLRPFEDKRIVGSFPSRYFYSKTDDILNRYFALFGVNDPIPLYLHKNDRIPYYSDEIAGYFEGLVTCNGAHNIVAKIGTYDYIPTLGDNGFFIRRSIILKSDMEHYFHIDNVADVIKLGYNHFAIVSTSIWHRTGGNIFKFFNKRLHYAEKLSQGRRWHMVEKEDLPDLIWFIFCTLTLVQPLYLSIKGYRVIKDKAWFLHLPICWITMGVYTLYTIKKCLKRLL